MSQGKYTWLIGFAVVAALAGCQGSEPDPGPDASKRVVAADSRPGPAPAPAATPTAAPGKTSELVLVEAVRRDDLDRVVSSVISPDGKFLYASCWNPGALVVFARDAGTGKLTHVQTVTGKPDLMGATGVALSPDGRFATLATFRSRDAFLFKRDPQSGKVTLIQTAPRTGKDWSFPVAVEFSPDGKFACFADDGGQSGTGGIRVFRVEGESLVDLGENEGQNRCFAGARNLAFHPDGKTLFVACARTGSLVVVDFRPDDGSTRVRQVLWAKSRGGHDFSAPEVGDVRGTAGLVDLAVSPDAKYLVTCSGRFGGPTTLASFRYGGDGKLSYVTSIQSTGKKGADALAFVGGNQVAIAPDGRDVYAAATISGVVACVARDPSNGSLAPGKVVPDGGPPGPNVNGAAGVTVSADGKFVYVATEDRKTLSVFRRQSP